MLYPVCHNSCYQVIPGGHYTGGLGFNNGLHISLYKRWLNRQSRFESTPVIHTKGLIKKKKKHYEAILMHNFIKRSPLNRAIGCFHVHQSYRGRETWALSTEKCWKKSTPSRWHLIGHSRDNSSSNDLFYQITLFSTLMHISCMLS